MAMPEVRAVPRIVSEVPAMPEVRAVPGIPVVSEVPAVPEVRAVPGIPVVSGVPAMPEVRAVPGIPVVSEVPAVPEVPALPGIPVVSGIPAVPEVLAVPGIPVVSEVPAMPEVRAMPALPPYRVKIQPDWIDYNGHLRDAYYVVALSYAVDDLMDHLGLDAAYRERTHCTLYTLELHIHYLHEVKSSDELRVVTSVLDCDRKRIHAACDFLCPRVDGPAAVADIMLLHVRQDAKPSSASFPPEVSQQLELLKLTPAALAERGLGSRKIELKRRP